MKVTKESYKTQPNVWKSQLEASAALFAIQVAKNRDKNANKVCQKLNHEFLSKKNNTKFKNCGPTALQKEILKNSGY